MLGGFEPGASKMGQGGETDPIASVLVYPSGNLRAYCILSFHPTHLVIHREKSEIWLTQICHPTPLILLLVGTLHADTKNVEEEIVEGEKICCSTERLKIV